MSDDPTQLETSILPRSITPVHHEIPVLDTSRFEHMQRIATVMADASLTPRQLTHYREGKGSNARWIPLDRKHAAANCFLVVNQAVRWGMDPFALAPHTYEVGGKLGFEGQAVIAVINASPKIRGKLKFRYEGERFKPSRKIIVSGVMADSGDVEEVEGTVAEWRTENTAWQRQPDQQLAYRGARVWARLHAPDILLGIYTADELEEMRDAGTLRQQPEGHYAPAPAPSSEPPSAPPEKAPTRSAASNEDEKINTQAEEKKSSANKGKQKSDRGKQKADSVNTSGERVKEAPESEHDTAQGGLDLDDGDWTDELLDRIAEARDKEAADDSWSAYDAELADLLERDPERYETLKNAFEARMRGIRQAQAKTAKEGKSDA